MLCNVVKKIKMILGNYLLSFRNTCRSCKLELITFVLELM